MANTTANEHSTHNASSMLRVLASPLRFHALEAAVSAATCSDVFPPAVAVAGLAPRLRGWVPTDEAIEIAGKEEAAAHGGEVNLLRPALDYAREGEEDTPRSRHPFVAAAEGGWFAAADAPPRGCLTVFRHDASEPGRGFQQVWRNELLHDAGILAELRQTGGKAAIAEASTTITALDFTAREVAVATGSGHVHVWRRVDKESLGEASGNQVEASAYERLMQPLWVDATPVRHVAVSGTVVVAHSPSKTTFVTWSLADGKILGCWNHSSVTKLPLRYARLVGANALVAAHWGGGQCAVQLLDVVGGNGGGVPLVDGGKGMECDPCAFDGSVDVLVFGDAQGSLYGFHNPDATLEKSETASDAAAAGLAAAAATTSSTSSSGKASSWQRWKVAFRGAVGSLRVIDDASAPVRVFAGCANGSVKALRADGTVVHSVTLNHAVTSLFSPREHGRFAVAGTEAGDVELLVMAPSPENAESDGASAAEYDDDAAVAQYDRFFIAGSAEDAANRGRASTKPMAYEEISRAPLSELSRDVDMSAIAASSPASSEGKSSKFDFAKGLSGAKRAEETPEEAASRRGVAAMDAPGVARNPDVGELQNLGRKCSNPTCLVREAVSPLPFKRCARCRATIYCSQHCQRTHWRDGHAKECGKKKEEKEAEDATGVASAPAPSLPTPTPTEEETKESVALTPPPPPSPPPSEQGLYDLD